MNDNTIGGVVVFVAIAVVIVCFVVFAILRGHEQGKIDDARELVQTEANMLDVSQDGNGCYAAEGESETVDPWGNPLIVTILRERPNSAQEQLEVRSAGPDGQYRTADDVTASRTNIRARGVGNATREFFSGVIFGDENPSEGPEPNGTD